MIIMSDHGMTYGSNPLPSHHPPAFRSETVNIAKVSIGLALDRVKTKVRRRKHSLRSTPIGIS